MLLEGQQTITADQSSPGSGWRPRTQGRWQHWQGRHEQRLERSPCTGIQDPLSSWSPQTHCGYHACTCLHMSACSTDIHRPSGATWRRVLRTSIGRAATQFMMPAKPPATRVPAADGRFSPSAVNLTLSSSYTLKYRSDPALDEVSMRKSQRATHASRKNVAVRPRLTERIPPSLYRCLNTSTGPLNLMPVADAPWTCSTHFSRSPARSRAQDQQQQTGCEDRGGEEGRSGSSEGNLTQLQLLKGIVVAEDVLSNAVADGVT